MSNGSIVVVTDDRELGVSVQDSARQAGWAQAEVFDSFERARRRLGGDHTELLVVDLAGVSEVSAWPQTDVPTVLVGEGGASEARAGEAFPGEVVGYLARPFDACCLKRVLACGLHAARLRRQLRERESRLRGMIDTFDGLIYVCSREYRVEYMNRKLIERTGRNAVGEKCYKALHDRDSICPWCPNEQVFAGQTVRWEIQSPKDDRWYYCVNAPLTDADGTVHKQSMIWDVTEWHETQEALAASERRYRRLIEQTHVAVLRFDIDPPAEVNRPAEQISADVQERAKLAECNSAAESEFGWAAGSRDGWTLGQLFGDQETLCRYLNVFAHGGCQWAALEWSRPLADGDERRYAGSLTGILTEDGLAELWLAFQDVTQSRRLAERLQANQRMETVGHLAGSIAHHFNNLLTVILGNAQWVQDGLPAGSDSSEALDEILRAGRRAASLTQAMLSYAQPDPPGSTVVDMHQLLGEVRDLFLPAVASSVRIEMDLGAERAEVCGDREQLRQLVMNLLMNAREAIPESGRIRLATTLAPSPSGDSRPWLRLDVIDNGLGMTAHTLAHAFDPFFTTREVGRGVGMGLAHVRAWAEAHGGRVELQSQLGEGTRVSVHLPLAEAHPAG